MPWNMLQVSARNEGLKMYYHQCRGCTVDHNKCGIRAELRAAIKGLNVTSIKFNCKERKPKFLTGNRVLVTLPFYEVYGPQGETDTHLIDFKGTVICERKTRGNYKVKIDDGPDADDGNYTSPEDLKSNTGYVAVKGEHVSPLNEFDRTVCKECEAVDGHEDYCPTQKTFWK